MAAAKVGEKRTRDAADALNDVAATFRCSITTSLVLDPVTTPGNATGDHQTEDGSALDVHDDAAARHFQCEATEKRVHVPHTWRAPRPFAPPSVLSCT